MWSILYSIRAVNLLQGWIQDLLLRRIIQDLSHRKDLNLFLFLSDLRKARSNQIITQVRIQQLAHRTRQESQRPVLFAFTHLALRPVAQSRSCTASTKIWMCDEPPEVKLLATVLGEIGLCELDESRSVRLDMLRVCVATGVYAMIYRICLRSIIFSTYSSIR